MAAGVLDDRDRGARDRHPHGRHARQRDARGTGGAAAGLEARTDRAAPGAGRRADPVDRRAFEREEHRRHRRGHNLRLASSRCASSGAPSPTPCATPSTTASSRPSSDRRLASRRPPRSACDLEAGRQLRHRDGDDGRGIDWNAIRDKAALAGIPHGYRARSWWRRCSTTASPPRTRSSETSARGVGMGALRSSCAKSGGRLEILRQSTPGRGTTLHFSWPWKTMAGQAGLVEQRRNVAP